MDSNPMIFDISSDEDPAFHELRVGDDDHEWLTELLETVDREKADTDDVVVVGEYVPPKPKSKSKSSKMMKDIDDDDCVVLDGDPDKPVDVADDATDDGDDVLVVGQKGQIACRDYPHPRHLCAKFPFNSTPHERHCDLCHCYICDSLAPCAHWGTGFSTIDHCHATDKQETWKSLRQESFRLKKIASLSVPKIPEAHLSVAVPQLNQVAALDMQLVPNKTQNQGPRQTTIWACSSARLNIPNIISQSRNQRPVCKQVRNGFMARTVSQQSIGLRSKAILQNRGQQFVPCNSMFKRPGIVRNSLAMNQLVYGSPNNMNCPPASHYARNTISAAAAASNIRNSAGWLDVLSNMNLNSYICPSPSVPNTDSISVNTDVPGSEIYSQLIIQSNDDQNIYQLGNQSQNAVDSGFPDFDFDWINNLGQSNQQTSAENINVAATVCNNEPTNGNQFTSQLDESTELCHEDHDFESWLLSQSDVVASEGCVVPADLNVFNPEPAAFDASMPCFDLDTSWNSLALV